MKVRNKGKVYPSPSSSSLPSSSPNTDALSVLNLLPVAILALASVLSLQDREVLAYMITRSLKSTNQVDEKKKNTKKSSIHKPPLFDCDCFDCYTSYWFRWDSSPNRELIHQAIEAFEEHLSNGEIMKKNSSRGKRKEKIGRRVAEKPGNLPELASPEREADLPAIETLQEKSEEALQNRDDMAAVDSPDGVGPPEAAVVVRVTPANNDKGLARKVLPDVLGLFNSRLWSLWSPNA